MKIKLFDNNNFIPKKSHLPDSGLDIFLPQDIILNAFETKVIGLKLGVMIPEGHAGILVPRSSIAALGLLIQTSIIDPDYTGEIHLIITNVSNQTHILYAGSRVCSIVAFNVSNPLVEIVDSFPITERNSNGLGSTGR